MRISIAFLAIVSMASCASWWPDIDVKQSGLERRTVGLSDDESCSRWALNEGEIELAFSSMEEVSSAEWGAMCYTLPCGYQGYASLHGENYKMQVNAGGHIVLINESKKRQVRYYITKKHSPFFLSSCDCCEDSSEGIPSAPEERK